MRNCWLGCVCLITMLTLGAGSAHSGSAVGRGNQFVVVTYWGDDKIAMVDLNGSPGAEAVFEIDVMKEKNCAKPYDVKVNKAGTRAYVTCSGTDHVIVVDLMARLVDPNTLPSGSGPRDIAITDDEKLAIVANSGDDSVSVISIPERRILYKVPVDQPYGVALTNDEKVALISSWGSGELHFIRLGASSGTNYAKLVVGPLPYTVVVPPNSQTAYVTVNSKHQVIAIDIAGPRIIGPIVVGRNPWGAAPSADGSSIIVANNRSAEVTVLKADAGRGGIMVADTSISVGAGGKAGGPSVMSAPKNVSISFNGKVGAMTDLANNELVVLNLENNTKAKTISVGKAPYGIEFVK
jgi:DNA-binding beta-propeller fold protein YncE